eukprot:401805-Rhodomonas_salina.1
MHFVLGARYVEGLMGVAADERKKGGHKDEEVERLEEQVCVVAEIKDTNQHSRCKVWMVPGEFNDKSHRLSLRWNAMPSTATGHTLCGAAMDYALCGTDLAGHVIPDQREGAGGAADAAEGGGAGGGGQEERGRPC